MPKRTVYFHHDFVEKVLASKVAKLHELNDILCKNGKQDTYWMYMLRFYVHYEVYSELGMILKYPRQTRNVLSFMNNDVLLNMIANEIPVHMWGSVGTGDEFKSNFAKAYKEALEEDKHIFDELKPLMESLLFPQIHLYIDGAESSHLSLEKLAFDDFFSKYFIMENDAGTNVNDRIAYNQVFTKVHNSQIIRNKIHTQLPAYNDCLRNKINSIMPPNFLAMRVANDVLRKLVDTTKVDVVDYDFYEETSDFYHYLFSHLIKDYNDTLVNRVDEVLKAYEDIKDLHNPDETYFVFIEVKKLEDGKAMEIDLTVKQIGKEEFSDEVVNHLSGIIKRKIDEAKSQ